MRVRPATPEDAHGITRVHIESWRSAYRGLVPDRELDEVDLEESAARWRATLEGAGWPVLVVTDGGEVKGFCRTCRPRDGDVDAETTGEIAAIYVDPRVWRQGYGRALCAAALAELARRGLSEVILWVFDANAPAKRFYEAMGFAPHGARKKHPRLGLDMVRYARSLG